MLLLLLTTSASTWLKNSRNLGTPLSPIHLIKHFFLDPTQFYPDEGHQLSGVKSHLFHSVSAFLRGCFRIPEDGEEGGENEDSDGTVIE